LTISQSENWSNYFGTNQGLLSPSGRAVQIRSGVKIGDTEYLISIFYGRISDYAESQGGESGSINLILKDMRSQFQKIPAITTGFNQSIYRSVLRQVKNALGQGGITANPATVNFLLSVPDKIIGSSESFVGKVLDVIEANLPSVQDTIFTGNGPALYGVQASGNNDYSFEYTDDNIISCTRNISDGESFNTANVIWNAFGVVQTAGTSTVCDATDVAKRGTILYPFGFIGNRYGAQVYSENLAYYAIAISLRQRITAQIMYNPYLEPGCVIKISSTKFSIPASYGKITGFTHQYQCGQASTFLKEMKIIAI
jgi:hypothetical protein